MSSRSNCYVYAGPSLPATARVGDLRTEGIIVRSPVERGDIARLIGRERPSALVIADGKFHQTLSVGHAEIRNAVEGGWSVWGVSSIGAIRAYEMRHIGVRGYGRVYRLFFRFRDFQDDEVALLHGADPPYTSASEPLVHMRFALRALLRRRLLPRAAALRVLARLKERWYGERTIPLLCSLVAAELGTRQRPALAMLERFEPYRVKQQDLAKLLAARPWSMDRSVGVRS